MTDEVKLSKPLFLAWEGGEGSGKTTQIAAVKELLQEHTSRPVFVTREPGGTVLGQEIRQVLLTPRDFAFDPRAEALLYAADRAQHALEIRAHLTLGAHVITDRYIDSSVAYQGGARGLGAEDIHNLSLWATHHLLPDLTIVNDIDPLIGLQRASVSEFGEADRIEAESLDFHYSVRDKFLEIASQDPQRYVVIDASLPVEEVTRLTWEAIELRLNENES